jgi:radical SAM superfamily enzyme YgiQ (UPF0313 family)
MSSAIEFERPHIIRPPSEHDSYFLPLTSGCSNNTCTFCGYYGSKLRMRAIEDVEREIDAVALHLDHGIRVPNMPDIVYAVMRSWNQKKVFLQDADALVYPFDRLIEILDYLNQKLPMIERVSSYATPQDILRRNREELTALRERKLSILYMGVESGDNVVLEGVGKGVDHQQLVEAAKKARDADIALSVTVILGLGGVERSHRHALETARVLSEIDPEYAGALTLTLVPGTQLYRDYKNSDFTLITPLESLQELKTIVENSEFTDCFFSSMHASNYYAVRGRLPQERSRILRELEHILSKGDPRLLRPEHLRGL